jgi:sulfoxide reductase heme-binding subunit YedZ
MAATSFNAAIRWLGPKSWRGLHRLIYLIVPMGVVHYYLLVKADHRPPLIYGGVVLLLLGWRAASALRRR